MLFDLSTFPHKKLLSHRLPWESLASLKAYITGLPLGEIKGDVSPQATLVHREQITIEAGAQVYPGAYIEGPCYIGANTKIGHAACIRPYTLTGSGCYIGHASEVKHSIFLNNAKAPHFNYVGDSIIGNHVNLGAGVICANLKLNKSPVRVFFENALHKTGQTKLGSFIGDGAQIGCNSVINPGAIISPGSTFLPNQNIRGIQPSDSTTLQNTV